MKQAAATEVVDGPLGHVVVVAEDHRLEDIAHGRAQASADVAAGGEAETVEETGEAASPPHDPQRGERRGEHCVLAAPREVPAVVELTRLRLRQRLDPDAGQPQAGALDQRAERCEGGRGFAAPDIELQQRVVGQG